MSQYLDHARKLRAATDRHYNCAQSVVIPFAQAAGIPEEIADKAAANFGSGMRVAGTCGAITGGLIALGLAGCDDPAMAQELFRRIRDNHEGCTECKDLLRKNAELGREKKPHCDAMVEEAVGIVEEILTRKGIL